MSFLMKMSFPSEPSGQTVRSYSGNDADSEAIGGGGGGGGRGGGGLGDGMLVFATAFDPPLSSAGAASPDSPTESLSAMSLTFCSEPDEATNTMPPPTTRSASTRSITCGMTNPDSFRML